MTMQQGIPLARVPTAFQGSKCVRGELKRRKYLARARYQVGANAVLHWCCHASSQESDALGAHAEGRIVPYTGVGRRKAFSPPTRGTTAEEILRPWSQRARQRTPRRGTVAQLGNKGGCVHRNNEPLSLAYAQTILYTSNKATP